MFEYLAYPLWFTYRANINLWNLGSNNIWTNTKNKWPQFQVQLYNWQTKSCSIYHTIIPTRNHITFPPIIHTQPKLTRFSTHNLITSIVQADQTRMNTSHNIITNQYWYHLIYHLYTPNPTWYHPIYHLYTPNPNWYHPIYHLYSTNPNWYHPIYHL